MLRICLISPGHLSTNPRLVKEALALKSQDYHVQVVHGRFKSWGSTNDAPIASRIGETVSVPFGPVEAPSLTYLRQTTVRHAALMLARVGGISEHVAALAHAPVVSDLQAVALQHRADLYIAHYVAALPAAAHAAKRHGTRYAFDAEDFHLGDLPDSSEQQLEKEIIRSIESKYLSGAAFVTAASPMIGAAYAETYGIPKPTVILNVFPKKNAPPSPTRRGWSQPGPSLYWFSQTIGTGRGLETAVEAIAQTTSGAHLYLRGTPARGYKEHLRALAHNAGVGDRLHFLEPAAPDELERLGSAFDLGYSGETGFSPNNLRALGNKLFSYVLGGVPTLASDIPAHSKIASEFGPAMSLFPRANAKALAAAIDALLHPERLAAARAHAWQLGQGRFNWELEQQKLLQVVAECLCTRERLPL